MLQADAVRDLLLSALEHARLRYRFLVYGFVFMPEHVHLVISEPARATLAMALASFKIASSKWAARGGYRAPGVPLWQARYYDRNLRDYEEFIEKLRYLHRNPVKRGLCALPEEWKWSSFRHYATSENCGVEIESRWAAERREAGEA